MEVFINCLIVAVATFVAHRAFYYGKIYFEKMRCRYNQDYVNKQLKSGQLNLRPENWRNTSERSKKPARWYNRRRRNRTG